MDPNAGSFFSRMYSGSYRHGQEILCTFMSNRGILPGEQLFVANVLIVAIERP